MLLGSVVSKFFKKASMSPRCWASGGWPSIKRKAKSTRAASSASRLADDAARVDFAFRLMLGHPPDAQQRGDILAFLKNFETTLPSNMKPEQRRAEAWTSVCQTLMASAEFRYVY